MQLGSTDSFPGTLYKPAVAIVASVLKNDLQTFQEYFPVPTS